jgi:hypothetical protein
MLWACSGVAQADRMAAAATTMEMHALDLQLIFSIP